MTDGDGGLFECLSRAAAEYGARTAEQPRVEATQSGAVRAYGPSSTPLGRAVDGLADVRELSYTAAEHHPFWPLLYHAADVAETVLAKWDGGRRLTGGEIDEMRWSLDAMRDALDRMSGRGGAGGGGGARAPEGPAQEPPRQGAG